MHTKEVLKEFFEEQYKNTSDFILYKDKQLLEDGEYRKFAQEQIKKANKVFWSLAFGLLICSWYGITSLIKYGGSPNWFDLSIGLTAWFALILGIFYSAKEYFSIKSSMNFFIRLINRSENETDSLIAKESIEIIKE